MAEKPMNILILMDDQHRHDALSCAGHSMAQTPNLDALVAEGTRFTQAVANLPICVPCRHSFITGYYAHQLGILSNQHSWLDPVPVPTLGMRLQEAGYATASVGKMHWKTATTKRGFDFRAVRSVTESPDEPVDISYEDAVPEAMAAVRVPLIVRWPGLKSGQVLDTPVELVDLMPTWLEAAGLDVPDTMPGQSLYPLLAGDTLEDWRTATFAEMCTIPGESRAQWILRENRYKLIERVSARSALYDLESDPNEFDNRIDDPALFDVRDRLRTALLHRVMMASETEAKHFIQ